MIAYSSAQPQGQPARALRQKLAGWLYRYLPAEILGTICALVGASLAFALTGSEAVAALVGAWAENLGFYGRLLAREFAAATSLRGRLRALRDIALEFGPAEALDSLLRPALMGLGIALLPELRWGVMAGKLAADLLFYGMAIAVYELRMKYATGQQEC
jgi:hypothetical protein